MASAQYEKLLLVGPPGTGKTMTAAAMAGELSLPLFSIQLDGLITKFMGETAAKLRLVFDAIQNTRPRRLASMLAAYSAYVRPSTPTAASLHIPKADGRKRPIGIPTLEDKILQRAVAMVLEAIYEQDFKDCSYGFRRGRSAHDALQALWNSTMKLRGGHIIDADISDFFGTLNHGVLRSFLDQRVTDGILRRVIHKWLKAGVLDNGAVTHPESGTPQGGVISLLLANIYLHVVLDAWFERDVLPRLKGRAQLVRYADDFVVICELEDDARKGMHVLPKRFGRYGLTLHPDKTRLVRFMRPSRPPGQKRRDDDPPPPQTFDFLSFTHRPGVSRKKRWFAPRRTSKGRLTRSLRAIWTWCRDHRHDAVREQHRALILKVRGHYGYYGITGNARGLTRFFHHVHRA